MTDKMTKENEERNFEHKIFSTLERFHINPYLIMLKVTLFMMYGGKSVLYPDFLFSTLTEVFPCFFLSCRANARVYLTKTGHGPQSSLIVLFHVLIVLFYVLFCVVCVVHVLFLCKSVLLPPGVNPIAVKYIISY